jgi:hypothetical protein
MNIAGTALCTQDCMDCPDSYALSKDKVPSWEIREIKEILE